MLTIVLAAAGAYFVGLGSSSLWDSNEAFYAETPREMIESGDYINPSFNYQPRFNKPPLSYWIVAGFYRLFGVSETVERVPIALAALAIAAVAFGLGSLAHSRAAGLFAALVILCSPRFFMFSRRIIIDVGLAAFISLSLFLFLLWQFRKKDAAGEAGGRLYLSLMYLCIGLGVMTKGPVAIVLPCGVIAVYLAVTRQLRVIRQMMLPIGLVIIAAVVLPWYAAIYNEHGFIYIRTFLLGDNLSRYTQQVWGPKRGFFFYLPVILGDIGPWSLYLGAGAITAVAAALRRKTRTEGPPADDTRRPIMLFLVLWITVIVFFFSLSRSKEDLYIMPSFPAAAALIGCIIARWIERARLHLDLVRWTTVLAGLILIGAGIAVIRLFGPGVEGYRLGGAGPTGVTLIFGGAFAVIAAAVGRRFAAVAGIAICLTVFNWIFAISVLESIELFKPVRSFAAEIESRAGPDARIGYYRFASPSMVFYLRRPIFEYYDQDDLLKLLSSGAEVYCIMTARDYETIRSLTGVPTRILASRPVFQVKLKSLRTKEEPARVILVTNNPGVSPNR